MSADPRFAPIAVIVSRADASPVILTVRQMDGLYRVAFSCEAAEMAEAIERGEAEAHMFGLGLLEPTPAAKSADQRARRFLIEMALALDWAWVGVQGAEDGDPELWAHTRLAISRLLREGDPTLGVAPLISSLGLWFNGPMLEIVSEGEGFGPSPSGAGAAGPTTATGVVH